jgi:hypothetical protein
MGCAGTHPPWFCRAFGKLPAREREKLIVDNKLCPFCLLHDKEKPCMAKQKQVSVACLVPGCKGRHVQKLHEALKDVLREEGRVHVLQEDDGWEESDGAWELGEEEEMIVGAVRQEDENSWSDTCDAWAALDEEAEAGVYQVEAEEAGPSEDDPEGGLLVEGEEREYVLELLLRETSLETQATDQSDRHEPASSKSKRKGSLGKKHHKRAKVAKKISSKVAQGGGGKVIGGGEERCGPRGRPCNPEARGGGAAAGERDGGHQSTPPPPILGRECSA